MGKLAAVLAALALWTPVHSAEAFKVYDHPIYSSRLVFCAREAGQGWECHTAPERLYRSEYQCREAEWTLAVRIARSMQAPGREFAAAVQCSVQYDA